MNLLIVGVIFLVFLIGFTSLYFVNDWYLAQYDLEKRNVVRLNQMDPDESKIILLGNSRVQRLNVPYMQNYLEENDINSKIHPVTTPGATISNRIILLEPIIRANPDMVVIGVDINDLRRNTAEMELLFQQKQNPLPNPQRSIHNFLDTDAWFLINTQNFKNPKLFSLKIIDMMFPKEKTKATTPRVVFNATHMADDEEMKVSLKRYRFWGLVPVTDNSHFIGLEKIINELSQNEIKTVIFVTPRPGLYIETVPPKDLENFFSLLDKLNEKYDVPVYSFYDKYAEMKIFMDAGHVGDSTEGLIFSEDVAKSIIKEWK